MITKRAVVLALSAAQILAGPALFDELNPKQAIVLVLPDGTCDAKVVERGSDQLTAKLTKTTRLCGARNALVKVLRADVRDIVDRRSILRPPAISPAGACAIAAMALVGGPAAMAVSEGAGSDAGALAVFAASAVIGGLICRDHHPRYGVFVERIIPPQP